jgi:protein-L-isoaspartate(D-aspartate) O-methyltransferase
MDYARARAAMVESQIRPADVTGPAIVAAFRKVPRENFLPPAARPIAYADLEPEAAPGRALLRPRDLAKLIQALDPAPGERALEIAGATGYGAAVLACCVKEVVTLDPNPDLSFAASAAFEQSGVSTVTAVSTQAVSGWADRAPYDVILVNGAAEIVPPAWLEQLAEGGRLGVIVRDGPVGQARIYFKSGGSCAYRVAFDAAPPVIPGLEKPRAFAF